MTVALALAPGATSAVETQFSRQNGAQEQADFAGWLSELVKSYLTAELESPGQSVESIKVSISASSRAPDIYDSFEITIPHRGGRGAKVFVLVSFSLKERIVSRLNVIAEVKVLRDVVVAKRSISRGAVLSMDDLEMVSQTVGPLEKSTVPDISNVIGMQADRNIRNGAILRLNQLSWPKMVRSGDVVSVIARSGSMVISVTGEAKQDGNRGEWIKVTNIESKKTISARVTGPGEVRVEF
jgi:flagella basal body P-ring formation protein FlgA